MSTMQAVFKLIAMEVVPKEKALAFTTLLTKLNIPHDYIVDSRAATLWLADRVDPTGDCFVLSPANEILYTPADLESWLRAKGLNPDIVDKAV